MKFGIVFSNNRLPCSDSCGDSRRNRRRLSYETRIHRLPYNISNVTQLIKLKGASSRSVRALISKSGPPCQPEATWNGRSSMASSLRRAISADIWFRLLPAATLKDKPYRMPHVQTLIWRGPFNSSRFDFSFSHVRKCSLDNPPSLESCYCVTVRSSKNVPRFFDLRL